jgi:hypothetical protein
MTQLQANPMTPPTCPLCHRRASERYGWICSMKTADGTPHTYCTTPCLSYFHDAGDWGPALLEAVNCWLSKLHDEDMYRGWFLRLVIQSIVDNPVAWMKEAILLTAVEGKEDGDGNK